MRQYTTAVIPALSTIYFLALIACESVLFRVFFRPRCYRVFAIVKSSNFVINVTLFCMIMYMTWNENFERCYTYKADA